MSQNNDDKPHSFTESAYKEGEEIDPVYEVGKNKDDGNKLPVSSHSEFQESKDIDFLVWYSGMEREKILRAYKIYIREVVTRKPE